MIAGKIREGATLPEWRRAGPASASGHRVQRTDAFGFVFRTVPLPAKLLRSRVYKPGPWLSSPGKSQMVSVRSEHPSLQLLAAPLPQSAPRCSAAFRCGGGLGPAENGGPNPSGSVASSTARAR